MRDIPPIFSAMFEIISVDNLVGLSIFQVDKLWNCFSPRPLAAEASRRGMRLARFNSNAGL